MDTLERCMEELNKENYPISTEEVKEIEDEINGIYNEDKDDLSSVDLSEPLKLYYMEIKRYKLLSRDEEIELFKKYENGDLTARQKIVESNLRLVVFIARRYIGCGMSMEDLVQEGNIGLIKAVEMYSLDKDTKFSTYAFWWIRQHITRSLANNDTIRIPVHLKANMYKYAKWVKNFEKENGRKPNNQELNKIYQDLHLSKELTEMYLNQVNITSLNSLINSTTSDSDNVEVGDMIGDDYSLEDDVLKKCIESNVFDVIKNGTLTEQEKTVIIERFFNEKTLEEVGKGMNLTRERIRQIEGKAIRKLRHPSRSRLFQSP